MFSAFTVTWANDAYKITGSLSLSSSEKFSAFAHSNSGIDCNSKENALVQLPKPTHFANLFYLVSPNNHV